MLTKDSGFCRIVRYKLLFKERKSDYSKNIKSKTDRGDSDG